MAAKISYLFRLSAERTPSDGSGAIVDLRLSIYDFSSTSLFEVSRLQMNIPNQYAGCRRRELHPTAVGRLSIYDCRFTISETPLDGVLIAPTFKSGYKFGADLGFSQLYYG
jgi:hypothetical protein